MEILIQSVLQAQRLRLSMHLRFIHNQAMPESAASPAEPAGPHPSRQGASGSMSYVIIHRPYQYLELMVRQLFQHALDVQVFVDRRWLDRREVHHPPAGGDDRRAGRDRRVATPMIDVLISVGQ